MGGIDQIQQPLGLFGKVCQPLLVRFEAQEKAVLTADALGDELGDLRNDTLTAEPLECHSRRKDELGCLLLEAGGRPHRHDDLALQIIDFVGRAVVQDGFLLHAEHR